MTFRLFGSFGAFLSVPVIRHIRSDLLHKSHRCLVESMSHVITMTSLPFSSYVTYYTNLINDWLSLWATWWTWPHSLAYWVTGLHDPRRHFEVSHQCLLSASGNYKESNECVCLIIGTFLSRKPFKLFWRAGEEFSSRVVDCETCRVAV